MIQDQKDVSSHAQSAYDETSYLSKNLQHFTQSLYLSY